MSAAEDYARRYERFVAGDTFASCGMHFRIVEGKKKPGDLRLDWYADRAWRPVTFEPLFYMTDFFHENEERLFPPPQYKGGEYVMKALRRAVNHGYVAAWRYVELEKKYKSPDDQLPFGDAS